MQFQWRECLWSLKRCIAITADSTNLAWRATATDCFFLILPTHQVAVKFGLTRVIFLKLIAETSGSLASQSSSMLITWQHFSVCILSVCQETVWKKRKHFELQFKALFAYRVESEGLPNSFVVEGECVKKYECASGLVEIEFEYVHSVTQFIIQNTYLAWKETWCWPRITIETLFVCTCAFPLHSTTIFSLLKRLLHTLIAWAMARGSTRESGGLLCYV